MGATNPKFGLDQQSNACENRPRQTIKHSEDAVVLIVPAVAVGAT
jgi:hypothetical protein